MNKPWLYKIGSFILGPIYKFYYNPKIINAKYLKVDGPVLIVGNHVHLYDQCNVIISTEKFITYMAKREYFDNKLTAWFFKSVGCIPVDRNIKDLNATHKALEVLSDGNAIGLFPEGTRNALKDEFIEELYNKYFNKLYEYKEFYKITKKSKVKKSQVLFLLELLKRKVISKEELYEMFFNLDKSLKKLIKENRISKEEYYDALVLPFKFGTVSMASKTDATIIPYGISGDYKFRSKNLKIKFGKPFKVNDMSLEGANNYLRDEIINLIK